MQLVFYTHEFAPSIGGVPAVVLALAQGLAGRKLESGSMEVTVITQRPAGGFDDRTLTFRVVRRPGLAQLVRLVRGADVLHLAGPCLLPMLLGLLLRKPVIVEHHGYQVACPNGLLFYAPTNTACPGHFLARRYGECLRCNAANSGRLRSLRMLLATFPRRWLTRRVSVNIGVTHSAAQRLALPRVQTIYHGVADPVPAPLCDLPSDGSPLCFAYVGRFVSEKGLPVLLEAASRLDERGYRFRLKLIGDGPERERLEAMVDTLRIRHTVLFTGFLLGEELQIALRDVSVVVMTTLMEETAGLAVIEQLMRGRLVIASDVGGLAEVMDGVGLKFAPGDVAALTASMRRVLEEPDLVKTLGRQARARSLQFFGVDRMIDQHLAAYRTLLENKERAC